MKYLVLFLVLLAPLANAQTVHCGDDSQTCPQAQDIRDIVQHLPGPSDWAIIVVPHHAMWRDVCADHCEIPAYTLLAAHRTYLDIERVYATAGLRRYLAHELGHIITNSTSEKIAEAKGQELLKSLHL